MDTVASSPGEFSFVASLVSAKHAPTLASAWRSRSRGGVARPVLTNPAALGYNLHGPTEYTINTLGGGTNSATPPWTPDLEHRAHILTPGCVRSRDVRRRKPCIAGGMVWPVWA